VTRGIGRNLLNKYISLQMLTINRVVTNPPLVLDNINFIVWAERGARGRGAGVTEIGWNAKRILRRSRSAHIIWTHVIQYCVYGVVFLVYNGTMGAYFISYLLQCIIRQRAISRLDNAQVGYCTLAGRWACIYQKKAARSTGSSGRGIVLYLFTGRRRW